MATMNKEHSVEPEWLSKTINLRSNVEIVFWCKMLRCSKRNLIKAVNEIGNSPRKVDFFLELNRLKYSQK
jgi:hypothetical protein